MAHRGSSRKSDQDTEATGKKKQAEVECFYCGKSVPATAMKCPYCSRWYSSAKKVVAISLAMIIILAAFAYIYLDDGNDPYLSDSDGDGLPDNWEMDNFGDLLNDGIQDPDGDGISNMEEFLEDTDPNVDDNTPDFMHLVSASDDDFWVMTPLMHPFPSSVVPHPMWINVTIVNSPILMTVRDSTTSGSQITTWENIYQEYSADVVYFDLTLGVDEPRASEVLPIYDPNGGDNDIPMTIIITKSQNNVPIWHAWEGVVEEAVLDEWMTDAVKYYDSGY
ncbi:MAG: hypothetical protein KAS16_08500 [Thermoplasmata archaeon]|nr:hypothetical protein [Thermoplasmata archaeon]